MSTLCYPRNCIIMSTTVLRVSRLITPSRPATPILSTQFQYHYRDFTSTKTISAVVDSHFISQITAAEKRITNKDGPVRDGPTARAQSHTGQEVTSQVVHEITMGERIITGLDEPVHGGPTAVAQSILSGHVHPIAASTVGSGVLDEPTISRITEKEKDITGSEDPVRRGPTAKSQRHVGEPITSQVLHDITEGEKNITGGVRLKGGPTATAQSELVKSRA